MKGSKIAGTLAFVVAATAVVPPMSSEAASGDLELRKKVISIAGIIVNTNSSADVSRAEFAQMLVRASSYKDFVSSVSNVSVFADVPRTNEYAPSVRIAAEQGWMTGYLGGMFRPEQPVTLQEAARGVLALLGYTTSDFGGDVAGARLAKFSALELNEDINKEGGEILTRTDCVNLFYNLLKTNSKDSNTHYGVLFDCELTSDGELNPMTMADNSVKGPILIRKGSSLQSYIPFDSATANIFLNGTAVSLSYLKSVSTNEYVVIYYSTAAKTVWAYSEGYTGESGRYIVRGQVSNIYYTSTDVLTPTAVCLDDNATQYKIEDSVVQFAFSIYGTLGVGDYVTLICEVSEDSSGNETYTVVDYIED